MIFFYYVLICRQSMKKTSNRFKIFDGYYSEEEIHVGVIHPLTHIQTRCNYYILQTSKYDDKKLSFWIFFRYNSLIFYK